MSEQLEEAWREIDRLRVEFDFSQRTADRLRAELAAEKEALAGLVNAADQLAAKSFFYDGFETKQIAALSLNILERAADNARPYAAIRASNAAPPQTERLDEQLRRAAQHKMTPEEKRAQRLSFIRGQTGHSDELILSVLPELTPAAPPHVEPSAAETEKEPTQALRDLMRGPRVLTATEARMLELAREGLRRDSISLPDHGTFFELAALVIETFGEKK